ncbi:hypothetical protein LHYA1_G004369 [Lachnellula hyalina]|uniref:Lysine-specific metallo-endopeptidase domain-containing protein n=1 Tax=Lachnellula hyalina TaxID=1316788 RepID=A0A8H8R347_9HELO|nr:uncharacterized protein LHYA1_G004369 [Lachnellula hyalina]TVY26796.1 hypothetical protein LHYA1_G004369 [Lachnellula hyalina]
MRLSTFLVFPALFWASNGQNINQLFHTVPIPGAGSCSGAQSLALNSWLTDTLTLVNAAMDDLKTFDMGNVDATPRLTRNLIAWFKVRVTKGRRVNEGDTGKITTISNTFAALADFLAEQNPNLVGESMPWLFCGGGWQVETDLLYEEDTGNPILDDSVNPPVQANMRTFPIPPGADDSITSLLSKMQQGWPANPAYYAYWSSDIRDYMIVPAAKRYNGNPRDFCTPPTGEIFFAFTIDDMLTDSVTICPDSFNTLSEPFETIQQSMAAPAAANVGTYLNDVSPRGLTLLHEFIHLTLGTDKKKTGDSGTKPTECLTLAGAKAVINPDSYAFFAWSLFLEAHGPNNLQWHTGRSQD